MSGNVAAVRAHVERFNTAVREGDFAPVIAHFTDDAELVFEGVPVGPFRGRDAITAAYADAPPDDEIRLLETIDDGNPTVVRYAWAAEAERAAGRMTLTWRGAEIERLVVTFDDEPSPGTSG